MTGAQAYEDLDSGLPLALLPVRIEARYWPPFPEKPTTLRLRVFPDTIHADDHRAWLSQREIDAGVAYWKRIWVPEDDADLTEARQWLATQVGTYRSVFIANQMKPINADSKRDEDPQFSKVEANEEGDPVMARLLPDEWMVRIYNKAGKEAYVDFFERKGDLVMAPSMPTGDDGSIDESLNDPRGAVRGFLEDQDISWTLDFDAAIKRGMAFELDVDDLPNPIGTLLVVGLRHKRKPVGEADEFFTQMYRHRMTRGLDIVPQGTPTNNTELGGSGVSLDEPDLSTLFDANDRPGPGAQRALAELLIKDPATLYVAPAADAISLAFGHVAPNAFDWVEHANDVDGLISWAMNMSIGYATLGGFLGEQLARQGGHIPAASFAESLRDHYLRWVRGGAALPTIRCGEQPYGIMPITSRPRPKQKPESFDEHFAKYLVEFQDFWHRALPAPTLDPDATDGVPATDPMAQAATVGSVIGAVPHPTAFQLRSAIDMHTKDATLLDQLLDAIRDTIAPDGNPAFGPLETEITAFYDFFWERWARITGNPNSTVPNPDEPDIEEQFDQLFELQNQMSGLADDYPDIADRVGDCSALLYTDIPELITARLVGLEALPAMFHELHDRGGVNSPNVLRLACTIFAAEAAELKDLVSDEDNSIWRLTKWFDLVSSEVAEMAAGKRDLSDRGAHSQPEDPLLVHLLEVTYLTVPNEQLVMVAAAMAVLYRGVLTSESITPDAGPWAGQTVNVFGQEVVPASVIEQRLEWALRESLGLAMHRYDAWALSLANQRFAEVRKERPYGIQIGAYGWLTDLEPSHNRASQGFVHGPSISHATTAAVLRAGWNAYGTESGDTPLSIDVSSEQVRRGQWILDGLRNGQDLAELLGARFERLLHDAKLDVWIEPLRQLALDVGDEKGPPTAIVDGLLLARANSDVDHTERELEMVSALAQLVAAASPAEQQELTRVGRLMDRLSRDLDAVADVVMFQSIHSLLQGDSPSAHAALAISSGVDAAIPPIRGTASPRDAQLIFHRLTAVWGAQAAAGTDSPFDQACPELFDWIESLLPDPAEVLLIWVPSNSESRNVTLSLYDLGIDAISGLMLAGDGASQDASDLGRVLSVLASIETGDSGSVILGQQSLVGDEVSVDEFGVVASAVRDALGRSRSLQAEDLLRPGALESDAVYDDTLAVERADAVEKRLGHIAEDCSAADVEQMNKALVSAVALGIPGALVALEAQALQDPGGSEEPDAGQDDDLVTAVVERIVDRIEASVNPDESLRAGSAPPPAADGEQPGRAETLTASARASTLLGFRMPVPAPFLASSDLEFATSAARGELQAQIGADAGVWMRQVGRARPPAGALADALLLSAASAGPAPAWGGLQLPDVDQPWVATGKPNVSGDQLNVVSVTGVESWSSPQTNVGLLFDSWIDGIPKQEQQTGIAVHFDAPTSRPPQAVLLSTVDPSTESDGFSAKEVADQLLYTLELAKLRAVSPEKVPLGQVAPAVYLSSSRVIGSQPETETS